MAYILIKSKGKNKRNEGYACSVRKAQIEYMALNAFRGVLGKRQTKYRKVIEWLDERLLGLRVREGESCERMKGIVGLNRG